MNVSYLDSLPDGYRFCKEDSDRCWEILGRYFNDPEYDMSEAESDFTTIVNIAEELKCQNNFWPTKESVIAEIERRAEARRAHDAMIRSYARHAEEQKRK